MRKKGKRTTIITVIVAGALVVALLAAGTVLRMRTRELRFADALRSFVADTFNPWR